jgi:hypothetical protein
MPSAATPAAAEAKSQSESVRPKATEEISLPPPPPKPGIGTYALVVLAFGGIVAGLTAAILSTRDATPIARATDEKPVVPSSTSPGRRDSPAASVETPEPAPTADFYEVTVRAVPPIATLWIDDISVGQGPHTARYKAGSRHLIRAKADGYVMRTETMVVTATASFNIVLEREAAAPRPRPRPGARATASAETEPSAKPAPAPTAVDAGAHAPDPSYPPEL